MIIRCLDLDPGDAFIVNDDMILRDVDSIVKNVKTRVFITMGLVMPNDLKRDANLRRLGYLFLLDGSAAFCPSLHVIDLVKNREMLVHVSSNSTVEVIGRE